MPTVKGVDPDKFARDMRAKGFEVSVGPNQGSGTGPFGPSLFEPKGPPATKAAPVLTAAPRRLAVEVDVPVRLKSEANAGGKLGAKIARKSAVKALAESAVPTLALPFPLPAVVTLTRAGAKRLDDDNLRSALKAVRDVVAGWLGVDDADPRVKWVYKQRPAWVPFCRIRIEHKGGT